MTSRLAIFCDRLLEAGWLAAIIVAPLFFNIYSSRVFEPDKAALVRSLALVMMGAWFVKQFEVGFPSVRAAFRENPLYFPTLVMGAVYALATIFSLVPNVSFWGSYQRMQGLYTTLSYIVVFFVAASTLRTRVQLDRVINAIIVTSFPIAFYGLLQHYRLDPLPWGGDTVLRVASNMGNSIFVAAYLIMVVPLTIARWLSPSPLQGKGEGGSRGLFSLALIALAAIWVFDFTIGMLFALALLPAAYVLARLAKVNARDAILRATYTLLLATQLVAILFTQSRGPFLGLAGGLFTFAILYALTRGARKLALGAMGVALVGTLFLAVFNLPASPLDPLKRVPYIGRLGQIFETESGTGKVRELIWEGALRIVLPHAPIWSPIDGDDALNFARPLVGYGLESMYVAFNPFYPPELAHLESRNASPDRSHNETFDALVMTGVVGFAAYLLLFISIFYYALKWLGLITNAGERRLFIALWLAGGFVAAFGFGAWRGWTYIGVALPAGMIAGFFVFIAVHAQRSLPRSSGEGWSGGSLWLITLISAIIAHFIEIHFGIAIVSTRLHFWLFAALLAVIGLNRVSESALQNVIPSEARNRVAPKENKILSGTTRPFATAQGDTRAERARETARRRKRNPQPLSQRAKGEGDEGALAPVLVWTSITTLVLITLTNEFINNQTGVQNVLEAVRQSLFSKPSGEASGIYLLFALTWLLAGIIGLHEHLAKGSGAFTIALFVALPFTAFVWFALLQERALTQTGDLTNAFVGLLAQYYGALLLLVAVLAALLYFASPCGTTVGMHFGANIAIGLLSIGIAAAAIYATNFATVAADIFYKSGANYDTLGAWDQSIDAHRRARELQPAQDFYALFLGRAYLQKSQTVSDANQRAAFLKLSEQTLFEAQRLNPLNTDHAANLARLNRIWAGMVDDPNEKAARYQKSSEYYQQATRLSPYTAYLRNEWGQTYFQSRDLEKMRAALEDSLQIDDEFAQTYLLLGEYYRAKGDSKNALEQYLKAIAADPNALAEGDGTPLAAPIALLAQPENAPRAIDAYRAATRVYTQSLAPSWALAELYKRSGQIDQAQKALEDAAKSAPDDLFPRLQLVNFYSEQGQIDAAVSEMRRVLDLTPPTRSAEYPRFQQFYNQLQTLQRAIQTALKSPNDIQAHRTLAQMWKARGQAQFAIPEYQIVARLFPSDYDAQKNIALLNLQLFKTDDAERALAPAVALAPANDKPFWQNIQMSLNDYKARQYDSALKSALAALAVAGDADKPAVQVFVSKLQEQIANGR